METFFSLFLFFLLFSFFFAFLVPLEQLNLLFLAIENLRDALYHLNEIFLNVYFISWRTHTHTVKSGIILLFLIKSI